jgi:hypothetical protein
VADSAIVYAPSPSLIFAAQFGAIAGALYYIFDIGLDNLANFCAVIIAASMAIAALWPLVSLRLGLQHASWYYSKWMVWLALGLFFYLLQDQISGQVGSEGAVPEF